jgi:hypothetical protein
MLRARVHGPRVVTVFENFLRGPEVRNQPGRLVNEM